MADQSLEVGLSYNFQVSIFLSSVSYVPEWVGSTFLFSTFYCPISFIRASCSRHKEPVGMRS